MKIENPENRANLKEVRRACRDMKKKYASLPVPYRKLNRSCIKVEEKTGQTASKIAEVALNLKNTQ